MRRSAPIIVDVGTPVYLPAWMQTTVVCGSVRSLVNPRNVDQLRPVNVLTIPPVGFAAMVVLPSCAWSVSALRNGSQIARGTNRSDGCVSSAMAQHRKARFVLVTRQ